MRLSLSSRTRSELTLAGRDALANVKQVLRLAEKLEQIAKLSDPCTDCYVSARSSPSPMRGLPIC